MELKTMICPHCGARLKIKQSGSIKCEYCDSDIFIEDSDINSVPQQNLSTEINSEVLKKWQTKRKVFIAVHFFCVFMGWFVGMRDVSDGAMVLFLLAGFSTFLLFPVLTAFSKPLSDAERAGFKKGKAVLREYLVMLLAGIIAFMTGAILGCIGVG
ncbi:MAG: hypothetical protein IJ666_01355 [Ruminococcus sp.]|nr:hypothetical protein [Ruminococcus sp.]